MTYINVNQTWVKSELSQMVKQSQLTQIIGDDFARSLIEVDTYGRAQRKTNIEENIGAESKALTRRLEVPCQFVIEQMYLS
ncbi:MAG: hypothetical protein EOP04_11085 [Proteobacteria bacterium]|nr:MAG: hypothetical protein EOP04_11085 [Pseudomonadota bacterium]